MLNDSDVIVINPGAVIRSSRSSIAMNTLRALPTGSTVGDYKARMRRLRVENWVGRTIIQALDEGIITLAPGEIADNKVPGPGQVFDPCIRR